MTEQLFWTKLNEKLKNDNWNCIDFYILQSYLRNGEKITIIDVSGEENKTMFNNSKIEYLNIPLKEIINNFNMLQEHANKQIICVCNAGPKSAVAAQILRFKGMDSSYISGGIDEMKKSTLKL
jgi:rhodanese-related sulfurtransferase